MLSYLRNPYPHVSGGLHDFYRRLHAGMGRSHGDSQISGIWTHTDRKLHINCLEFKAVVCAYSIGLQCFRATGYLDPYRPQAPYQLYRAQGSSLCPTALGPSAPGPPGYDCYGHFNSSFVYQQARRDPFPHLVTFDSRASPLVRGSDHNSPSEAYSRLSERDSRPPISSDSANIDRVVPLPRDHETYLQALGDTRSRHVCNSVELPPFSVHVSNSGATSPTGGCSVSGLAGDVNVHVSSIQSA